MDCESKLLLAEYMLQWAQSLVADAVRIMDPEQTGKWTGVRAWQESVPNSDEEYQILAELLDDDDGFDAFVAYKNARPSYLRIRRNLTIGAADGLRRR